MHLTYTSALEDLLSTTKVPSERVYSLENQNVVLLYRVP